MVIAGTSGWSIRVSVSVLDDGQLNGLKPLTAKQDKLVGDPRKPEI
jgi:hypothetical protein